MDAPDPDTPEGRKWLATPDGRDWLASDDGFAWQRTDSGWAWLHSPEGREWLDERAHHAFEAYFSGDLPPKPEWAMTPDEAPRVGARLRIAEDHTTLGGVTLHEGELVIVIEARLAPVGCVHVTLMTLDGRKLHTMDPRVFTPA